MTFKTIRGRVRSPLDRSGSRAHRKAVLSCPRCGHESPIEGDWLEVVSPDEDVNGGVTGDATINVYCPDCNTHLTKRSQSGI